MCEAVQLHNVSPLSPLTTNFIIVVVKYVDRISSGHKH